MKSKIIRAIIVILLIEFIILGGLLLRGYLTEKSNETASNHPHAHTETAAATHAEAARTPKTSTQIQGETLASTPAPIETSTPTTIPPTPQQSQSGAPQLAQDETIYPAKPGPVKHRVATGDTWESIAQTYSCSVQALKTVNPDMEVTSNTDLIIPLRKGDQAKAAEETAKQAAKASTSPSDYTIKKGDTLSRIARQHNVSIQAIQQANGIKDPGKIHPGQVIIIPGK